jgi:dolichyl-phosphate beta-glucosyltransferase
MERPGHQHVSIVVPAFNEERRIERTITMIAEYMNGRHEPHDIIVSDDGSVDATGEIVNTLQRTHPSIQLVRGPRNEGKGSAVRRGVATSTGDLILVTDADLATPIEEFESLLAPINAGADIAIGSRGMRGSRLVLRQPIYREMMGRLFNVFVQLAILPGVFDTQCGFKLFRGSVARRLFAHAKIDGFAFDVEVLGLAAQAAYRLVEVPVRWSHVNHSKVSLGRDSLSMFRDMVRIAYWLRTSQYDVTAVAAVVNDRQPPALPEKP